VGDEEAKEIKGWEMKRLTYEREREKSKVEVCGSRDSYVAVFGGG
jgi:galactokinase/mevalonate kinase-like predicted kinase